MRGISFRRTVLSSLSLVLTTSLCCPASVPAAAPQKAASAAKQQSADDHLRTLVDAGNKAYIEKKYDQAESSFKGALQLVENNQGLLAIINKAMLYSNLGTTYFAEKKYPEAERAYKSSIDLQEKLLTAHHEQVAETLQHYAALLRRINRTDEADKMGTQAEFLKVHSLSGKDSDFKFEPGDLASKSSGTTSPTFASDVQQPSASELKPALYGIKRIVKMSSQDKSILENPTTMEKPVYRQETYWEGGMWNPLAGAVVGAVQKTRDVLDHYEKVNISSENNLSYVSAVADFQSRYQLSQQNVRELLDAINSGGAAVELDNGWLMVTNEDLNPSHWYTGMKVQSATRPTANASYNLRSEDNKFEFVARRVAVLNT